MEAYLLEWANLLLRWLHVIAGIAWIGSSFYFVHLDSSLKRPEGLPPKASGEAWQVHGGGFYHMVKYMVAPDRMPAERHSRSGADGARAPGRPVRASVDICALAHGMPSMIRPTAPPPPRFGIVAASAGAPATRYDPRATLWP